MPCCALEPVQVLNVLQYPSCDPPGTREGGSQGRKVGPTTRDAILCSKLKGHQAAVTAALITSDTGVAPVWPSYATIAVDDTRGPCSLVVLHFSIGLCWGHDCDGPCLFVVNPHLSSLRVASVPCVVL